MTGFFRVTLEALWSAVVFLCILGIFLISTPGKRIIAYARRASAPRLLVYIAISLSLQVVGWYELIANMEVREPRLLSQILMGAFLPGIWLALWLEPNRFVFTGVPFVVVVSSAIWSAVLYGAWSALSRWRRSNEPVA